MRVTLPENLAKLVKQKLDDGIYASGEEMIEEALKLLDQRDRKLEALRGDVQEGLASGAGRPFNQDLVEDIKKRGRQQSAFRKHPN